MGQRRKHPSVDNNERLEEKMVKGTYKFGIKEVKELGWQAVVLADDTHLVIGKKELTILYPKKKFTPIFKKQMSDRSRYYIGVSFSDTELSAIMQGMDMLLKKKGTSHKTKMFDNLERKS